jgi:UDP-2,3-diacylglucosamine pyrophosphatase LpxH
MKNIYIGDIHGLTVWKEIVEAHPDATNIVFVGDYFDSFDVSGLEQLHNVEEIVQFKIDREQDPNKHVYLLVGNHDLHYWPGIKWRGSTSGYQPKMLHQFEHFFRENEEYFQMAVCIGKNLCTHAGVSSAFLKDTGYWTHDYKDESHVVEFLNGLFKHKPNEFDFSAYESRHYGLAYSDPYGNNEGQSPVWIRPSALQRSNNRTDLKKNYIQIVGHTQQPSIDIKGKTTGGKYYYIDTLSKGEYLIELGGVFSVGKLKGI